MTILAIYEQTEGRGGTATAESTVDDRVFLVKVDTPARDTYYVGNAVKAFGLAVGASHPSNLFAIVKDVSPKNIKPRWWRVTVKYSTVSWDKKDPDDPDDDPIHLSIDEDRFQRPAVYNRDGEAILTSARTRPNPPIMVEDSNRIINIEGSFAGTGFPDWEGGFRNRINADSFRFIGTTRVVTGKRAKVASITVGKIEYRGGDGAIPYRPYKIQIILLDEEDPDFDDQTSFLDAAFVRLPTASEISEGTFTANDQVDIVLPGGAEPKEPVLLDGSGQPKFDADGATAVFRQSKTLYLANFAGNLPGCVAP